MKKLLALLLLLCSTGVFAQGFEVCTVNQFFAGPTAGNPAIPKCRAMVAGDVTPVLYSGITALWTTGGVCNNTTYLRGDGSCITPSGAGTVTHTAGNLTAKSVVLGNAVADIYVVAGFFTDGTSIMTAGQSGTSVGEYCMANATTGTVCLTPTTGALGSAIVTFSGNNTTIPIFSQVITFTGPSTARTITLPDASFTVARTDAANTFTGTQTIGALVATTLNGNTFTAGTYTLTGSASKTLNFTNSLTLSGTDSTTMTFPTTSATIARTDAGNTFTGHQTFEGVTSTGATGTGAFVFATTPTLVTPVIGAATGTSLATTAALTAFSGTAIPAGCTAGDGVMFSSTANFGMFFGSGAPTCSVAEGSLYLQSDGAGLAYINSNGTTGWIALASTGLTNSFTGAQIGTVTVLTESVGAIAINLATNNNFSVTLNASATLSNPSNGVAGESGQIAITQGASTAYSFGVGTSWLSTNGAAQNVNQTLSSVSLLSYYVVDSTHVWYSIATNNGTPVYGTQTNDNAAAGYVGEFQTTALASGSAVALTTTTTANVLTQSLTAGDWDCWGVVDFHEATTTNTTLLLYGISTTSATLGSADTYASTVFLSAGQVTTNGDYRNVVPMQRISLASTTNVYLVAQATFTISTNAAYGSIFCRRAR